MIFLRLLYGLTLFVYEFHCLSLYIDRINGRDTASCLTGTGLSSCQSLEYIAININSKQIINGGNDLMVLIISQELILTEVVSLSQLNNFTLQGTNQTVITCGANSTRRAGIQFINSSNVNLLDFTIENCSAKLQDHDHVFSVQVSLHSILMYMCTNISIAYIEVINSSGYGLSLINSKGAAVIYNCTFQCNTFSPILNNFDGGAGGILLNVYSMHLRYTASYTIKGCKTIGNNANLKLKNWSPFTVHGGGMVVALEHGSYRNIIEISDSEFINNTAQLGGGLYVVCKNECAGNTVVISKCTFRGNNGTSGGGGADIGISADYYLNSIKFTECTFTTNVGKFGGGIALYAIGKHIGTRNQSVNSMTIESCSFYSNTANGGAAVDVNPGNTELFYTTFTTTISFTDCLFRDNWAGIASINSSMITQSGTFFISRLPVIFSGRITFFKNQGSALYVSGTTLTFANCVANFSHNIGEKGGGILLVGQSLLVLQGNNNFTFTSNTASYGGAICALVLGTRYFQYTDFCFIRKDGHDQMTYFYFEDNLATTGIANDIFVSNLLPCVCDTDISDLNSKLNSIFNGSDCIGKFTFSSNKRHNGSLYATATSTIKIDDTFRVAPGLITEINILQNDQFGNNVGKLFPLSASLSNSNSEVSSRVKIDPNYVLLDGQHEIILHGKPGDKTILLIQSNSIAVVMASTQVVMTSCPPGNVLNTTTLTCDCEINAFIDSCKRGRARLKNGNWVGYIGSTELIATGVCAQSLCHPCVNKAGYVELPLVEDELNDVICGNTRRGTLCGRCINGFTAYYNSRSHACRKVNNLCSYGVLFYFLSEILPITLIFVVIIVLNVHITSGFLYSFIFYSQLMDFFRIDAFEVIKFNGHTYNMIQLLNVFYGIFNMKVFHIESLSFCFKEDINNLDIFLLQYLVILYALFLIIITLVILKLNSLHFCIKICHKLGKRDIRGSVINGLTAFIVLCYFKCVVLTSSILIPVDIHIGNEVIKTVALFDGELEYLKGRHLYYAIPAFLCLFLIILPPPLFLLSESVLLYLNQCLKIKRNSITYFFRKMRMKFMPFLDSFQGCFRDNCRYFAGLFFIYRIIMILPNFFSSKIMYEYIVAEVMLLAILIGHYLCRPFQKSLNNKLDILLLTNLITINMITILHYFMYDQRHSETQFFSVLTLIQLVLMSIPALYAIGYCLYRLAIRTKFLLFIKRYKVVREISRYDKLLSARTRSPLLEESLPYRLIEEEYLTD